MGGACSAYALEGRRIRGFGGETKENDLLEDPGENGWLILRWMFRKLVHGLD